MADTSQANTLSTPGSLTGRLFLYAENDPTHDAVVTPALTLSYFELSQLVRAQAKVFKQTGFSNNAVIGIKCADDVHHLILCLATIHLGLTSCTIPTYENDQIQNGIIERCGITHIADEKIAIDLTPTPTDLQALETKKSPAKTEISEPKAQLLFSTSGTTGEPKLVVHYDSDMVAQAHRHIDSQQERFACLATMEHNFAKRHRLYCVAVGATNLFLSPDRESLISKALSMDINVLHVSAFQAQELLTMENISKLSHIRLKLGGSHVPLSLRQQLKSTITSHLQAGYGTTETGAIAFTKPDDLDAGESVGQPLPGIEIRVVTPERKPLDIGEHGELAIRCKGMFRGYLSKPELTATKLDDGWFYTGDIGYLDNQQRIFLCGRSDDMFVFNSMNIYPQDIESEIRQFPGIIDTAVLPKKSSVHGNIPVALVVFARYVKQDLSSLKKFVQKRVGVRSPRQYIIVTEIPRNTSGKIARLEAISLPAKSGEIRSEIINLLDEKTRKRLKPSLINDFINGDKDITFNELRMDSLARMDFLVALETTYNTAITLQEFSRHRYLGNFATLVLSLPSEQEENQDSTSLAGQSNNIKLESRVEPRVPPTPPPYLVRLFQRTFSYCQTVAQLSKVFSTLEHRLTPEEIECLFEWQQNEHLLPIGTAKKFKTATTDWLNEVKNQMLRSGKSQPETFVSHRLAPNITLFAGGESAEQKTLIICFPPNGSRNLTIPNAVLMQHTNATRFDLLIVSDPTMENYQLGVPPFGKHLTKTIEQLISRELISNYGHIRTMGFSAGAHPAIVAGHLANAEMAISINGRFHRKKHLFKNLDKVITTWKAVRKRHCSQVLLSYSIDNSRDRKYTKVIGKITNGNKIAIQIKNEKTRHLIIQRLLERGELAEFLTHTIFAEVNGKLTTGPQKTSTMSFPSNQNTQPK